MRHLRLCFASCCLVIQLASCQTTTPGEGDRTQTAALATQRFRYDPVAGSCKDELGRPGHNALELGQLFGDLTLEEQSDEWRGKDAECVDFAGLDLQAHLNPTGRTSYVRLIGWNLKGAQLDGVNLRFIILRDAALQGASFEKAVLGYTTIAGSFDAATRRPAFCKVREHGTLFCRK